MVTNYLGVRNIFDLTIDTRGSIPLVFAAMLIEALVVDCFFYWFHRCQHTANVLWQVHMLHHSDTALNVTTTHRVHFLEHLLTPIEPEHRDKNFAVWFPIYDVLFGTAHRPKRGEFPATGVAGVEVETLSDAFMLPFERWWAMAKGSFRR